MKQTQQPLKPIGYALFSEFSFKLPTVPGPPRSAILEQEVWSGLVAATDDKLAVQEISRHTTPATGSTASFEFRGPQTIVLYKRA